MDMVSIKPGPILKKQKKNTPAILETISSYSTPEYRLSQLTPRSKPNGKWINVYSCPTLLNGKEHDTWHRPTPYYHEFELNSWKYAETAAALYRISLPADEGQSGYQDFRNCFRRKNVRAINILPLDMPIIVYF